MSLMHVFVLNIPLTGYIHITKVPDRCADHAADRHLNLMRMARHCVFLQVAPAFPLFRLS